MKDYIHNIYSQNLIKYKKIFSKDKSQFFTPLNIANKMVESLKIVDKNELFILDPCCGFGILSIVLLEKILTTNSKLKVINVFLLDIDIECLNISRLNIELFHKEYINIIFNFHYINQDFLDWDTNIRFDYIIQNPPFKKMTSIENNKYDSDYFSYLKGQANIYHLFLIKSLKLINNGGILINLSPKNYLSGMYTEKLRKLIFENYSLTLLHTFDERKKIFTGVLQEVCITHIENNKIKDLLVSHNGSNSFMCKLDEVILNKNSYIILSPRKKEELKTIKIFKKYGDIQKIFSLKVGSVVQFRIEDKNITSKNFEEIGNGIPLIVPRHLKKYSVVYGKIEKRNNNITLIRSNKIKKHLLTNTKRLILKKNVDKKNSKLITVSIYNKELNAEFISLDNNLSYVSFKNDYSIEYFYGVFCILNSRVFDDYYRMINGNHTVNVYEFDNLYFPKEKTLKNIGLDYIKNNCDLNKIDKVVNKYLK